MFGEESRSGGLKDKIELSQKIRDNRERDGVFDKADQLLKEIVDNGFRAKTAKSGPVQEVHGKIAASKREELDQLIDENVEKYPELEGKRRNNGIEDLPLAA